MPLYGNELGLDVTPFDAGLGRVVKLARPDVFVGRAALERAAADGPRRSLVGLIVRGRGIARHGYRILRDGRPTGVVTSGTQSPTLGLPIAMGFVAPGDAAVGTMVEIEIRDQPVSAEVVELPFYRRPTA
jgi:aminomethyltransferase